MKTENNMIVKDQSGVALVIALIMMAVLTLIGLASMSSSIFEITLSGNRKDATVNFYQNDATVQSLLPNSDNFPLNPADRTPIADIDKPTDVKDEPVDSKTSNPTPKISLTNKPALVIYHLTQEDAPRGAGISATNFTFQHFIMDAKDKNAIQSNTHIREKAVKLVPTSQGGSGS
jgi:type IV pilus assembly protein PilX